MNLIVEYPMIYFGGVFMVAGLVLQESASSGLSPVFMLGCIFLLLGIGMAVTTKILSGK